MKNFITQTDLLKKLSSDHGIILLDARAELMDPSAEWNQYKKSHISHAQFVSLENTMTGKVGEHGGRHPLPDMEKFIETMRKLGMTDHSTVVIYDDGNLAMAGRLWWLLKYAGKNDVYLLEGGMKKWIENKLEVTDALTEPVAAESLSLNKVHSMLADVTDVTTAIHSKKSVVVDSRTYERYSGQLEPLDARPGHIPNALNYPWTDLVNESELIHQAEVSKKFEPLKKYDEVIVHCGSGITGTVNILFMEEVGLKPKLYLGGYSDWVSYEEHTVEKEN